VTPLVLARIKLNPLPCAWNSHTKAKGALNNVMNPNVYLNAIVFCRLAQRGHTFANELLWKYNDPYRAALEAGYVRIRPVLMTALAMIIGMVRMALGLGDGGEQNAPLGRAVIGGLIFATAATLFFVPTVFILVNKIKRSGMQGVSAAELALG
jgi:hypothetical protein